MLDGYLGVQGSPACAHEGRGITRENEMKKVQAGLCRNVHETGAVAG